MAAIKKFLKAIDFINEKISVVASYLMFLLILTLSYEVLMRYGFNKPTQWSFDATYFLCSLVLVLAMAYTWQKGEHVGVDLITAKLPRRFVALLNVIFISVLFFFCWYNIARVMIPHVQRSWLLKERSMTGFMPPIYPYKTWILVGVGMMLLQGVAEFVRELCVLITGGERP